MTIGTTTTRLRPVAGGRTPSPTLKAVLGIAGLLLLTALTALLNVASFEWVPVLVIGLWLTTTSVVGALIMTNRPENPVGALMVVAPLIIMLGLLAEAYASYVYELGHRDLPYGSTAAWLTLWLTIPGFALFIHLLLRFPTGHLPSPRWRWASHLVTAGVVATCLGYALRQGPIDNVPGVDNPLGSVVPAWVSGITIDIAGTFLPTAGCLAILSLFLRYRRAGRSERQQMKWFVSSVAVFPLLFALSQLQWIADDGGENYLGFFLVMTALLLVPISMGIGILRHRLYDIDLVVNRALVYGALTAILGFTYLGSVVSLQSLLAPLAADSDLAVAASTLAVAAAFRPLRSRVQAFIDRRFYRRKYDAAETLGAFSSRMRDQVDLDSLNAELVKVIGGTMQPAHVSIWLRPWGSA